MVDQISKNWNTQHLLLLKCKDHLQNAQYINKNQQDQVKVEVAPNTEDASYQLDIISNDESSKDEINQDEEQEAELISEVKELIEKALEGDPDSQLFLGQLYQEGNGVKQNNAEAIK